MISPPDSVLSIWFLFVKCNSYYPKSLDLLEEGKLGDPGEHKIKRRQYTESNVICHQMKKLYSERNQLHILTDDGSYCNIKRSL